MDQLKEKIVLITGGAGFIGSHIAETLLKNGVKGIKVLDNLSTGSLDNINYLTSQYSNIEFIKGDICDYNTCYQTIKGVDVVCHQAALGSVPRSINDPLTSHNNNVNGFLNMLHASKENNVKRFIYASSSSVYGNDNSDIKIENIMGEVLSPYALTKYIDELYASLYTRIFGMECIGLRYFNVFGPRQNPNGPYAAVIPKFISSLLDKKKVTINGDGTISRDFTYVDNVVYGNILALSTENQLAFGQVFNMGVGKSITLNHLYSTMVTLLESDLKPIYGPPRKGDIPYSLSSYEKAHSLLGFNPKTSFEKGLEITIKYSKKS